MSHELIAKSNLQTQHSDSVTMSKMYKLLFIDEVFVRPVAYIVLMLHLKFFKAFSNFSFESATAFSRIKNEDFTQ